MNVENIFSDPKLFEKSFSHSNIVLVRNEKIFPIIVE